MTLQNATNNVLIDNCDVRLTGTAIGDLFFVNSSLRLARVPIGATGQALIVNPTVDGYTWQSGLAPSGSAGGDLTGSFPNPSIASNAVTFPKIQNTATNTILGRVSALTGNIEALTPAQVSTMLGLGTASTRNVGIAATNLVEVLGSGKIDSSIIPAIAIGTVQSVATNAAKLALTGLSAGEAIVRVIADETRGSKPSTYALSALPIATEANWILLSDEQVDAGDITTGIIAPARLGSNSPDATKFLRGDGSFQVVPTGVRPITVVTTSTQMAVNNRYVSNAASRLTMTLPTTAAVGDSIQVYGYGTGGFSVSQNASQNTRYLDLLTTTGVSGKIDAEITNTNSFAGSLDLVCVVANTGWLVVGSVGVFDVV